VKKKMSRRACVRPAPYSGLDYNDSFCSALVMFASCAMLLLVMILLLDAVEDFCQKLHLSIFFAPQALGLLCVLAAAYSTCMRTMVTAFAVSTAMMLVTSAHIGLTLQRWSECTGIVGDPVILEPRLDSGSGSGSTPVAEASSSSSSSWPLLVFASTLCTTEDLTEGVAWIMALEMFLFFVYLSTIITLVRAMNNLEIHKTCCFSDLYIVGAPADSVCRTCGLSRKRPSE